MTKGTCPRVPRWKVAEVGLWARAGPSANVFPYLLPPSPAVRFSAAVCGICRVRSYIEGPAWCSAGGTQTFHASCALAASRTCGPSKGSAFSWTPCCQSCWCSRPRRICTTTPCTGPVTSSCRTRWGRWAGRGRVWGSDGAGSPCASASLCPPGQLPPGHAAGPAPGLARPGRLRCPRQQDQSLGRSAQEPGVSAPASQRGRRLSPSLGSGNSVSKQGVQAESTFL